MQQHRGLSSEWRGGCGQTESEFHRGGGREDSPHRQRPVRGHQALEASRRHKRLLLPRHNLCAGTPGVSVSLPLSLVFCQT